MTLEPNKGSDGFSLLETMLAILILSVVLTGVVGGLLRIRLQTATLVDRATQAGDRARADDREEREAWMWGGPQVVRAEWTAAGLLDVHVSGPAPGPDAAPMSAEDTAVGPVDTAIGAWVDGWFVGEATIEPYGAAQVGAGVTGYESWPEEAGGAQVVLRVRVGDGAWGPPWRTLHPQDGDSAAGAVATEPGGAGATVHRPGVSPVSVDVAVDGQSLTGAVGGPVSRGAARLLLRVGGAATVTLGSQWQGFEPEEGRWVDVYF